MKTAQQWIEELNLQAHPEGGFYAETYRSQTTIGDRATATSIYFLLRPDDISHFHILDADELWYFHSGTTVRIHMIDGSGNYSSQDLGQKGDLSVLIPANTTFAAEVLSDEGYVLVSCVVTPGFEFSKFHLYQRDELVDKFPSHAELIARFTPEK